MTKIDTLSGQTREFAIACYDTNSRTDLHAALSQRVADKGDCRTWGITPTQWRETIRAALSDMEEDDIGV